MFWRILVGIAVLGSLGVGPLPPSGQLSPAQRQELEAALKKHNAEAARLFRAGNLALATENATQALAVSRKLYPAATYPQGHTEVARTLQNLGVFFSLEGKTTQAERTLRETLDMRRRLHSRMDHADLALTITDYAVVLERLNKHSEAEQLYREALAMRQRLYPNTDHNDVATSLNNLGVSLARQGKFTAAEPLMRDALAVWQRLHPKSDHRDVLRALNNLTEVLRVQRKAADAEEFARAALGMLRRMHPRSDHPELAASLHKLALILENQWKLTEAESSHREALAMRQRLFSGKDHAEVAISLNDLGFLLREQGKYTESESCFRAAYAMRSRLYPKGDHPFLATSMGNLAGALQAQGKYVEAESLSRDALSMRKRLHPKVDHEDVALALNNLAGILTRQKQYVEAEQCYRDALAMRQRLSPKQDHPSLATIQNNLAALLTYQEKYQEAERLHGESLAMRKRLYGKNDHPDLASSRSNLGFLLRRQGKDVEAETLYLDALAMRRRLHSNRDHRLVLESLNNLVILYHALGKDQEALPLSREALAMSRRLTDEGAASLSEGEALNLAAFAPLNLSAYLSCVLPMESDASKMYAEIWRTKSAIVRLSERRHLAARAAVADASAMVLLGEATKVRRRRSELILAPKHPDPGVLKKRDEELTRLIDRLDELEQAVRRLLPALERVEKLASATPDDLRKLLPADVAVIDFLAYTHFSQDKNKPGKAGEKTIPSYLAFVLTRDKVVRVELGAAKPIEESVNLWREALVGAAVGVPADQAAAVRKRVWDPVRKHLPQHTRTVYLAPDSALTALPWAALPGDKAGTILLEDYAFAVVPHVPHLLAHLWPADGKTESTQQGMLVVGGVGYSDAVAQRKADPSQPFQASVAVKPGQRLNWPALPETIREAKGIAALAEGKKVRTQTLSGADASTERVLKDLPTVRFAHLATHGFFADEAFRSVLQIDPAMFAVRAHERLGAGAMNPMVLSGLVFAGANQEKTPGRGLLTGEALIDRDLSGLDLAVLSACETGLGHVAGGEGVFGLQRAFHLAGTRNVVASLWKVDDSATAALMAVFYRQMWEKDQPPIEALRQAQLEIYRHPDRVPGLARGLRGKFQVVEGATEEAAPKAGRDGKAHPRFWAAFSLSGPGSLR